MPADHPARTNDEILEQILLTLERMNRRDRMRTIGAFFRALLGIIPLFVFLYGTWYFIRHTDDIIRTVSQEAAKQAAAYTQTQSQDLLQQLQQALPRR